MALSIRVQLIWWGIAIAIAFGVLAFLGDILLPFVIGLSLAYLLDPVVDRFEGWGVGRKVATGIASVLALLVIVLVGILIMPLLGRQVVSLLEVIPANIEFLKDFLVKTYPEFFAGSSTLDDIVAQALSFLQGYSNTILNGIFGSINFAFQTLSFLIVVPVVMIYMLADWDKMTEKFCDLLPRDHESLINQLLSEVNQVLASFVRGQLLICFLLGSFYAVALYFVGLEGGIAVGFLAGLLSFIPLFGAVFGGIFSIGLAIFQFWSDPIYILLVAVIFLGGQVLESNFLTPKIVGNSIGLHPVWILFSLSAFGLLFGFIGLLLAVPIAAICGVFTRFGIKKYKEGSLYLGAVKRN